MTGKELFREIGMIKEEYIEEAESYKRSIIHNTVFSRSIASAACLIICVGLYFGVRSIGGGSNEAATSEQAQSQIQENATAKDEMHSESTNGADFGIYDGTSGGSDAMYTEEQIVCIPSVEEGQNVENTESTENIENMLNGIFDCETDSMKESVSETQPIGAKPSLAAIEERLKAYSDDITELCQTDAYVILHGYVKSGQQSWDDFVGKVEAREAAEIDIIQFTIEGDPIITYLHFDGVDFYVVADNTRDAFAGNGAGLKEYRYGYLNILLEGSNMEVFLSQEANLTKEQLASGDYDVYHLGTTSTGN